MVLGGNEVRSERRATIGPIVAALTVFVVMAIPGLPVLGEDDPWYPTELEEVMTFMTWEDPDENVSYVTFEYSKDGTRLLVVSHGLEPKVRRMSRDLEGGTVVDLGPDLDHVIDARWSETDRWAAIAWAHAGGGPDRLTLFNATTWERYDLFENDTTPLEEVSAFIFVARDDVLVLAGRDANGTSRMLVLETRTLFLLRDFVWRENVTVRFLGHDSMVVQCVDDSGALTVLETRDWTLGDMYHPFKETPTCLAVTTITSLGHPWTIGYGDGNVAYYHAKARNESTADIEENPILGVAWVWDIPNYYVVGSTNIDQDVENTRMRVFRFSGDTNNSYPSSEYYFLHDRSPTMMATDPLVEGQFLVGFTDGTVAIWRIIVRENLPPTVTITAPEEGQRVEGLLVIEGTAHDDWDRTKWVRVQVSDGNWFEATGTDNWTIELNMTQFDRGKATLHAQAYDGEQMSRIASLEIYIVGEYGKGDDGEWPRGIPLVPFVIIVLVIALIVMFRAYRRKWGA